MHESGLIRKLIQIAIDEATSRGGDLRSISIRLGALAGGSPEHLRGHFEIELRELGLEAIRLDIEEEPFSPTGVDITSIEIAK